MGDDGRLLKMVKLFHLFLMVLPFTCVLNNLNTEATSSTVKSLPGFPGPLPFHLETGYIGVDDVQLFYYFIKSEGNPREDPLMLWLTGGPGCSSFSGLVYEIGPIRFNRVEYNGSLPTFSLNPFSWTKASSIIFLDVPVGTGFSYSTSLDGWKSSNTKLAKQVYIFLQKWLRDHPNVKKNPIYVGGDSYGGMMVPIVVQEISNGIEAQHKPHIDLKGYILGNPATDRHFDENSKIPFVHRMALISDELFESIKRSCKEDYADIDSRTAQCALDMQTMSEGKFSGSILLITFSRSGSHSGSDKCIKGVNSVHILEPNCPDLSLEWTAESRRYLTENFTNLIQPPQLFEFGCRSYDYLLSNYWANDNSVRDALRIKKGTIGKWWRCQHLSYIEDVQSTVGYHLNLSRKGFRALIYSGDHDRVMPYLGTEAWIKSLNFSILDDWRPWFVDDQVAGYTRTYSNHMTFATVMGAGHTAPEFKPKECFAMFNRWLSHKIL